MSYLEIFMWGWNLNAAIFLLNLIVAIGITKKSDPEVMMKENEILRELKNEFDQFYPNRGIETLVTYMIPFTAFFRGIFRIFEMMMFFKANQGTKLFDFMVYKYQNDINKAKRN